MNRAAALLVLICAASVGIAHAMDSVDVNLTFGQPESKEAVKVKRGGEVRVILESNPTTGYSWSVQGEIAGLKEEASKYEAPTTGLVGGGGTQLYKFQAEKEGKHELVFVYKRPWEADPVSRAVVDVDVV